MNALLRAEGLGLERGGRALFSNLSLTVSAGCVLQIEGGNGAGKTSLLRVLAGLMRYGYEGTVERHSAITYIGHQSAVKGLLTPRENLRWHPCGTVNPADSAILEALGAVGLAGYEDEPCHTLSAGQHRRVNLARLFLSPAPLWLLDEPFTAIDRRGVDELRKRLERHIASGGAAVVTSHQHLELACTVDVLDLDAPVPVKVLTAADCVESL